MEAHTSCINKHRYLIDTISHGSTLLDQVSSNNSTSCFFCCNISSYVSSFSFPVLPTTSDLVLQGSGITPAHNIWWNSTSTKFHLKTDVFSTCVSGMEATNHQESRLVLKAICYIKIFWICRKYAISIFDTVNVRIFWGLTSSYSMCIKSNHKNWEDMCHN